MIEWRPISELTPVLWQRYVVAWQDGTWGIAMWKTNSRWGGEQSRYDPLAEPSEIADFERTHRQPYFGDPVENDDDDMATTSGWPVLYLPFKEPPTA